MEAIKTLLEVWDRNGWTSGPNVFSLDDDDDDDDTTISEIQNFLSYESNTGTAVAQCLRRCATNRKVAGSIPAGVNGVFIDIKSFRSHYGPGVDLASNRNEYQ